MSDVLWATKMLFVWRWRLGYWDVDAFLAALKCPNPRRR